MKARRAAGGTLLPVEPLRPFPADALKAAAKRRAGSLSPYLMSSSDFDIAFLTPVLTYAAQQQTQQPRPRTTSKDTRKPEPEPALVRPLLDFGDWSDYFADFPPVLLVRVTPKLAEGFWTTVARGAACTQGVALPPIKRFKPGFSRHARLLRRCRGDAHPPVHARAARLRDRRDREGLYVFDPGAFGPHCESVKLVLYSEKEPEKGDTRVVDPKVIERIWQDFAPYRTVTAK